MAYLEQVVQELQEGLQDRFGADGNTDAPEEPAGTSDAPPTGGQGSNNNFPGAPPGTPNLGTLNQKIAEAAPENVCLPRRREDCYDLTNGNCWENPQPRESGWGCGGVRMRLACDPTSFMAPKSFADLKPGLVSK